MKQLVTIANGHLEVLTEEKLMYDIHAVNHFYCGCHIVEKKPGIIDPTRSFFCKEIRGCLFWWWSSSELLTYDYISLR